MIVEIITGLGLLGVGVIFGLAIGERVGIHDTERRWSEAVTRAEDRRKQTMRYMTADEIANQRGKIG